MACKEKELGQTMTPVNVADVVLDVAGYRGRGIVGRTVLEPSCGDGVFLRLICRRIIGEMRLHGFDNACIASEIENDVYAVELDGALCRVAIDGMVTECASRGVFLDRDAMHVENGDAFDIVPSLGRFDFVIGNPPYVRIHNMGGRKPMSWCSSGMTDAYIGFFQLGTQALSDDGILCYIAPSSWLSSRAACQMRRAVADGRLLRSIVDLGHEQVFDGATTYVAIAALSSAANDVVRYQGYDEYLSTRRMRDVSSGIAYGDGHGEPLLFCDAGTAGDIRDIMSTDVGESGIRVSVGYQTSADSFFVGDRWGDAISVPVVKASTGKRHRCLFPYDRGTLSPLTVDDMLGSMSGDERRRAMDRRVALSARQGTDPSMWLSFGRSQGLSDTFVDKIAVNLLYRDGSDVMLTPAPAGTGVYGGSYITGMTMGDARTATSDDMLMTFVRSLRTYKRGGYYAISSRELNRYLVWWDRRRRT